MLASMKPTNCAICAASGRGPPGGGINPPRNLRTTFSQTSACVGMLAGSSPSSDSPPASSAPLWHSVQ
jgi:hypothetical protein